MFAPAWTHACPNHPFRYIRKLACAIRHADCNREMFSKTNTGSQTTLINANMIQGVIDFSVGGGAGILDGLCIALESTTLTSQ